MAKEISENTAVGIDTSGDGKANFSINIKTIVTVVVVLFSAFGFYYKVMSDIEEFVSPVDKSVIGSRSGLRNHERRHGIRQIGNDWSGSERTSSAKPDNWQQ